MTQEETSASQRLSLVSLLVCDYDEAIAFYVGKVIGFRLMEDTRLSSEKHWVVVGTKGGQASLLLAKAVGKQTAAIGRQRIPLL